MHPAIADERLRAEITIPTASIFEGALGADAGAQGEVMAWSTILESQVRYKIVANSDPYLRHFYRLTFIIFSTATMWRRPPCLASGYTARGFIVALQDYVRSIAAKETVSKNQVFRFLEMQFALADKNHDGELDVDELAAFAHAVSCPETDQR
jgi:hypothetical protein